MPAVRPQDLSLIAVACFALLAASGCAGDRGSDSTAENLAAQSNSPTDRVSDEPSDDPLPIPAGGLPPAPAASRTTAGAPPAGSVARLCRMVDLRFWLSLALPNAGPYGSGSIQMTNTAADRCRVSGYITVRFLDGNGKQMPITVEHLPGSMPGYTSVVQPGKSAFAGLRWTRSRALPSDPEIPCPPVPASLEVRLSGETNFARMAWSPGDGLCDSKAGIQPIESIP